MQKNCSGRVPKFPAETSRVGTGASACGCGCVPSVARGSSSAALEAKEPPGHNAHVRGMGGGVRGGFVEMPVKNGRPTPSERTADFGR